MTAETPEGWTGGSGLDAATFLSVDDLLEVAEQQATDDRTLYHIREARQQQTAVEEQERCSESRFTAEGGQ